MEHQVWKNSAGRQHKTPLIRNKLGGWNIDHHQPPLRVDLHWQSDAMTQKLGKFRRNPPNKQPLHTYTFRRLLVDGWQRSFCWHLVVYLPSFLLPPAAVENPAKPPFSQSDSPTIELLRCFAAASGAKLPQHGSWQCSKADRTYVRSWQAGLLSDSRRRRK